MNLKEFMEVHSERLQDGNKIEMCWVNPERTEIIDYGTLKTITKVFGETTRVSGYYQKSAWRDYHSLDLEEIDKITKTRINPKSHLDLISTKSDQFDFAINLDYDGVGYYSDGIYEYERATNENLETIGRRYKYVSWYNR